VGSMVGTYTEPYRHPEWKDGVPTEKRFEQYAVVVTLLQILLGMQSQVELWSPMDAVELFSERAPAEDRLLHNLREYDDRLIPAIKKFFKNRAKDGKGYLEVRRLRDDKPVYETMKKQMTDLAKTEQTIAQRAATSNREGGFEIDNEHWQTQAWQQSLLSMITAWENVVKARALRTYQNKGEKKFDAGVQDLLTCFNTLKRSVGETPAKLSRINLVGNIRELVERILVHLIRRMRDDPSFDPVAYWPPPEPQKPSPWVGRVFQELEREQRQGSRHCLLDHGFYHTTGQTQISWLEQGSNIARLYSNLKKLRDSTHAAHHLASLTEEAREKLISHEHIHKELMPRLNLLFRDGARGEKRMLH